jgi:probable addiction module antidote protein
MESPERCDGFLQDKHPPEAGRTRKFRRPRSRRSWGFRIERALWPRIPRLLRPGWRNSDFVDWRNKENATQGHRESEGTLDSTNMPKRTMLNRTRDHQSWLIEKLANPRRAANYLNTALEDSPQMFLEAVRDVAQARQMTRVAKNAGVTRESLYKATSPTGNPTFETFVAVLTAMDLTFEVVARGQRASAQQAKRRRRAASN